MLRPCLKWPLIFLLCMVSRHVSAGDELIAASHPLATETGIQILKEGGNAVDAAVAAAFVLGVVEPYHGGIGGGALILIRPARGDEPVVIDALEVAPESAYNRVSDGWKSVGIPGCVAGLVTALDQYGTQTLESIMAPAIRIAQEGFVIDEIFHNQIVEQRGKLLKSAESSRTYLPRGRALSTNQKLVSRDLAWSYRRIARDGARAFYQGIIAKRILHAANGNWFTPSDLANYRVQLRRPIYTSYRGYDVLAPPPPCAGGLQLLQCLNMLEPFDMAVLKSGLAEYVHVLAEVLQRSSLDRRMFIGDTNDIPVETLISKEYAAREAMPIQLTRVSRWNTSMERPPQQSSATSAVHVSVIDSDGNMVAISQTLHRAFGSGIMVPGTGIMLNNAVADFSDPLPPASDEEEEMPQPNLLAPGRRPATQLAPVILLYDGRPFLVAGSTGTSPAPSAVLQMILNIIDFGMNTEAAIGAPYIHQDSDQQKLLIEWGMPVNIPALVRKGHTIQRVSRLSHIQAVGIRPGNEHTLSLISRTHRSESP